MSLLILLNCCTFLPPSFLHFLFFLQIASCHPLQHTYIMSLLQRLLEASYPSLEVQMQVSITTHSRVHACNTSIKHFPICILWSHGSCDYYYYIFIKHITIALINLGHYYFKRKSNTSKLGKSYYYYYYWSLHGYQF